MTDKNKKKKINKFNYTNKRKKVFATGFREIKFIPVIWTCYIRNIDICLSFEYEQTKKEKKRKEKKEKEKQRARNSHSS